MIRAACKRGLVTPGDHSICGFNDMPTARQLFPRLAAVRQPGREMERAAALELLEAIHDADADEMMRMSYTLQLREPTSRRPETR